MKRRAVFTTKDSTSTPAEPSTSEATVVPVPSALKLSNEPIRRSSRLREKGKGPQNRSKFIPTSNVQSRVRFQVIKCTNLTYITTIALLLWSWLIGSVFWWVMQNRY